MQACTWVDIDICLATGRSDLFHEAFHRLRMSLPGSSSLSQMSDTTAANGPSHLFICKPLRCHDTNDEHVASRMVRGMKQELGAEE